MEVHASLKKTWRNEKSSYVVDPLAVILRVGKNSKLDWFLKYIYIYIIELMKRLINTKYESER